jgi:cobalamin-dependent methionine synthase I
MRKIITYEVSEIEPYINWLYFYHAWNMDGKPLEEKEHLHLEAEKLLDSWQGKVRTRAVFGLYEANSDGDDLLLNGVRIPMLRQQKAEKPGEPNLCMADFVRPLSSGIKDRAGAFATTVDTVRVEESQNDPYRKMLLQTLSDRLAEGTAERMHEEVRRHYWGYAPDEHLTMQETHLEKYQGIRPAVGYPSLPDTSMNFILSDLLDMKEIGIRLTESGMMIPHASVSGFLFSNPQSRYFDLGKIGEDQLLDYARRRGLPVELMRHFLQSSLLRK